MSVKNCNEIDVSDLSARKVVNAINAHLDQDDAILIFYNRPGTSFVASDCEECSQPNFEAAWEGMLYSLRRAKQLQVINCFSDNGSTPIPSAVPPPLRDSFVCDCNNMAWQFPELPAAPLLKIRRLLFCAARRDPSDCL